MRFLLFFLLLLGLSASVISAQSADSTSLTQPNPQPLNAGQAKLANQIARRRQARLKELPVIIRSYQNEVDIYTRALSFPAMQLATNDRIRARHEADLHRAQAKLAAVQAELAELRAIMQNSEASVMSTESEEDAEAEAEQESTENEEAANAEVEEEQEEEDEGEDEEQSDAAELDSAEEQSHDDQPSIPSVTRTGPFRSLREALRKVHVNVQVNDM